MDDSNPNHDPTLERADQRLDRALDHLPYLVSLVSRIHNEQLTSASPPEEAEHVGVQPLGSATNPFQPQQPKG